MPQEFHVVRCYRCELFQVEFVKKSKKWKCKVCGEAQSLKKVFARGSGIECRKYVQELNLLKKTAADNDFLNLQTQCLPEYSDDANQDVTSCEIATQKAAGGSKWSQYLCAEGDNNNDDDDDNVVNYPAPKHHGYTSRTKQRFKPYGFTNAAAADAAASVGRQRNDDCWTLNSENKPSLLSETSAAFMPDTVYKKSNEISSAVNNGQTMSGNSNSNRKRLPVTAVNCPLARVEANTHSSAAATATARPSCRDREKQQSLAATHLVNRSSKWSQFVETAHPTENDVVGDSVLGCGGGSFAIHSPKDNASSRFSDLVDDSSCATYCRRSLSPSRDHHQTIAPRPKLSDVFSVSEELDDVLNM